MTLSPFCTSALPLPRLSSYHHLWASELLPWEWQTVFHRCVGEAILVTPVPQSSLAWGRFELEGPE